MIVWWGDPTIIKTIYFIQCDLNPVFSHRLLLVTSAFGTKQPLTPSSDHKTHLTKLPDNKI